MDEIDIEDYFDIGLNVTAICNDGYVTIGESFRICGGGDMMFAPVPIRYRKSGYGFELEAEKYDPKTKKVYIKKVYYTLKEMFDTFVTSMDYHDNGGDVVYKRDNLLNRILE